MDILFPKLVECCRAGADQDAAGTGSDGTASLEIMRVRGRLSFQCIETERYTDSQTSAVRVLVLNNFRAAASKAGHATRGIVRRRMTG